MTLPDDELLKAFARGELDASEEEKLGRILEASSDCRRRFEELSREMDDLSVLSELGGWRREQESFRAALPGLLEAPRKHPPEFEPVDLPFVTVGEGGVVVGRIGSLELVEFLGAGSMGAVFRARDAELEREVAVKVLRPEFADSIEAAALFLDEARAMAALRHDHVLPVYDVARSGSDHPFLVMPLVEGGTLRQRIEETGPLSAEETLALVVKIASAIATAHEAGVLHRDVKPSNVLLGSGRPDEPGPWLSDFGLARAARHGFGEGSVVGTRAYAAPEVLGGGVGSEAADLFSLGVLFHETATGRLPESGIPDPSFPADLLPLLQPLLAEDPADRPKSARAFVEAMAEEIRRREDAGRAAADILSRRRRRRLATAALGVLVLAAIGLDGLFGWKAGSGLLRLASGKTVSVGGRLIPFDSLEEALSLSGDLDIRISGGTEHMVSVPVDASERRVRISGSRRLPPVLIFREVSSQTLVKIGPTGEVEFRDVEARFRMTGRFRSDAVFAMEGGRLRIERSLVRCGGSRANLLGGDRVVLARGDARIVFEGAHFTGERMGPLIVAAPAEGEEVVLQCDGLRMLGQSFLVVENGVDDNGGGGKVRASLENSTILATCPFRFGPGPVETRLSVRSRNCLWQCGESFLSSRDPDPAALRLHFSFEDEDSIAASGGSVAIASGNAPPGRRPSGKGDPEALKADWEEFRTGEGAPVSPMTWVEWIVEYGFGTPPVWNPDLDVPGRGAEAVEDSGVFQ